MPQQQQTELNMAVLKNIRSKTQTGPKPCWQPLEAAVFNTKKKGGYQDYGYKCKTRP